MWAGGCNGERGYIYMAFHAGTHAMLGLQNVFSFEAQLHNLSELINTNDWYGYGELNSFWIQQDDNFFMIEKLFW